MNATDPFHPSRMNLHTGQTPHWSFFVEWRPDRWDPMSNAPTEGHPILRIRGRDIHGNILEPIHYACGGGEDQPAFKGWFIPYQTGSGYYEVFPVEWQPLHINKS